MSIFLGDTPLANTGYDKANTDLSNLTNTGKNIANWSNNVTNCITEIPQDIKFELNNGTLTLKAGSKVYVPNGFESDGTTPKFDIITIASDITYTKSSVNTGKSILFLYQNLTLGAFTASGDSSTRFYFSGNTTPSNVETYGLWYDTANNLIKYTYDSGSTWTSGCPLPLAIFSYDTSVTSINQVFNGFGYIGSTVFALPGVKGLIPNGRNADGTLNNIESVLTTVHTYYLNPAWGTSLNGHTFYLRVFDEVQGGYAGDVQPDTRVIYSKGIPSSSYTGVYYDINENKWFWVNSGVVSAQDRMFIGVSFTANITSSTFTVGSNWNPKTPFHALDYNDSSTISGWSMPSSRYIDLTLGASLSTYIAPANGWFFLVKTANANGQYIYAEIDNPGMIYRNISYAPLNEQDGSLLLPVKKGAKVLYTYTAGGNTKFFRFIYAEGEN